MQDEIGMITHPLLVAMVPVARMIAETFGANCEVVLHDLRQPRKSVVLVANGHVTGRRVGQSFRDMMDILTAPDFAGEHFSNYAVTTKEGKVLKSSTALLRDERQEVIGALCINFDLGDFMQCTKLLQDFCAAKPLAKAADEAIHNADVTQILVKMIATVIAEAGLPVANMQKADKLEIVRFLNDKGVFLIKGAVEEVAGQLNVSRFTVYNYLDEVRAQAR